MQTPGARRVVGVVVTATACLHCAPESETPDPAGAITPEIVEEEQPRAGPAPRLASAGEPFTPATKLTRTDTVVTSTVEAKDGALYEAGTFSGSVLLGGERLDSKGRDDVFLAKWRPDGSLAWALSVGSQAHERTPRIGDIEQGRVRLIGLTEGEMDCGSGPLPTWTSETFFFCVFSSEDGSWLAGGTFPTGEP